MTIPGAPAAVVEAEPIQALLRRLVGPEAASCVEVTPLEMPDGRPSAFSYRAEGGRLRVAATDGPTACAGVYAYLKDVCDAQVGWDGPGRLTIDRWPDAPSVVRTSRARVRYYLNVVTSGYSAPFWDQRRWAREVDWMALHGITTPLMTLGHEAVLMRAFTGLGAPEEEVRAWLGGAPYLPWTLMGSTSSWGGPLPRDWFRRREALARRVLAQQRSLGMRTVLPAFGGHVPDALAPAGTPRTTWQGYSTALLDAREPRFAEVAAAVARAQRELLGTDHLYAADPFIESIPPSGALLRPCRAGVRGRCRRGPG